jgi:hypothetical protein
MSFSTDGGCLCGGVRYRLHDPPKQTWGAFRRDKIEMLSGSLRKVAHAGRLRSFAACCGTQLLFEDDETTEWVDVTIASLDQPESFRPEVAIWTEDKLPWVILDPVRRTFRQERKHPL